MPITSTAPAIHASASSVASLDNGHLSMRIPEGFYPLTAAQIAVKFPSARPPKYVFANRTESISIAVTLIAIQATLPDLKTNFETSLARMVPGFKWIHDDYTIIDGTKWVDFEFTSHAVDTDIHNDTLFTNAGGGMIGVNFNTTVRAYSTAKSIFSAVKSSLVVH